MMNLMEDAHTITLTPNQRNHNESGMDKFEIRQLLPRSPTCVLDHAAAMQESSDAHKL